MKSVLLDTDGEVEPTLLVELQYVFEVDLSNQIAVYNDARPLQGSGYQSQGTGGTQGVWLPQVLDRYSMTPAIAELFFYLIPQVVNGDEQPMKTVKPELAQD